jgi:ATP-dependent helicase STH1/SNF2
VDDEEDTPEAAAARKQARKERREQNRLKRPALSQSSPNNAINEQVARPDGDTRPLVIREKVPTSTSK